MHSDAAYRIGSTHAVCQDFARCGDGYAIISDGCSGSKGSEVGAVLLSVAMDSRVKGLQDRLSGDDMDALYESFRIACTTACCVASGFSPGLAQNTFDATLGLVIASGDYFAAMLYGDGMMVGKQKCIDGTGVIVVDSFSFPREMPEYPNYDIRDNLKSLWNKSNGGVAFLDGIHIHSDVDVIRRRDTLYDFEVNQYQCYIGQIANWEWFAVASDGFSHILSADNKPVDLSSAIQKAFNFKSMAGVFAERRLTAFVKKDMPELGWSNADDISIGALSFV